MIWLTPTGEYLVQRLIAPLPNWASAIIDASGDRIQPAKFYLVTSTGVVSKAFSSPIEYSVDDQRGLTNVHAVIESSLVSYHVIDHISLGSRIEHRFEVAGLTPVPAETAPPGLSSTIAAYEDREQAKQ